MKKILLTIIGLALASSAWSAQTAVTEISGIQPSVGALKTQVNTRLGTVESNRQDHEARVAAMEDGKADKTSFTSQSAFTSAWGWAPGGLSSWSDVRSLLTGDGNYVTKDGTLDTPTGSDCPTGQIKVGETCKTPDVLSVIDGLTYNSGVLGLTKDTTPSSGSTNVITSGAVYTGLAGKVSTDGLKTVGGVSILGSGDIQVGGGSGGYISPPTWSDSSCTAGQYSFHATYGVIYCKATSTWDYQVVSGSSLVWAGWNNPTPVARTLTITDPANGTIQCSDSDLSTPIDCGTSCTATTASSAVVSGCTAVADSGYTFSAWTGDLTGSAYNDGAVTMTADKSGSATFVEAAVPLGNSTVYTDGELSPTNTKEYAFRIPVTTKSATATQLCVGVGQGIGSGGRRFKLSLYADDSANSRPGGPALATTSELISPDSATEELRCGDISYALTTGTQYWISVEFLDNYGTVAKSAYGATGAQLAVYRTVTPYDWTAWSSSTSGGSNYAFTAYLTY